LARQKEGKPGEEKDYYWGGQVSERSGTGKRVQKNLLEKK